MGISFSVRVKAHVPKPIHKKARDRQTDGQDRYMMGPPSRKDGSIVKLSWDRVSAYVRVLLYVGQLQFRKKTQLINEKLSSKTIFVRSLYFRR